MGRLLGGRALRTCARAKTPLGIVYETDAMVENRLCVVDVVPRVACGHHFPGGERQSRLKSLCRLPK
jgi:hypothetical protein